MARVGDDIFLVWTEPDANATKLQAMRISWQAVGTKLLTTKLQNLPSHAPEGKETKPYRFRVTLAKGRTSQA